MSESTHADGAGRTAVLFRMADASLNKGEEAVMTVILDVLRPLCDRIVVCDDDPDLVRERHGVDAERASQRRLLAMWRTVGKTDLAVWAGGHMAQDISSQWSILGRLWLPFLAKWRGRRLLIYAVDVGPLRTRFGRWLSRRFFAQKLTPDDLLIVRNPESFDLLVELGVAPDRIQMAPDPALSCTLSDRDGARAAMDAAGIDRDRPIIAIAPRATFHMRSSFLPASVRLRLLRGKGKVEAETRAFQQSLARTADRLVAELGAQVVLVPMDTGPNPRDDLLCEGIRERAERKDDLFVLGHKLDLAATFGLMAEMDMVISGRFHGCVFAAVGGTPVVPMDTGQHKVPRLMNMLGYPRDLLRIQAIAADATGGTLFDEAKAIWDRREEEAGRIRERVAEFRVQWQATSARVQAALAPEGDA